VLLITVSIYFWCTQCIVIAVYLTRQTKLTLHTYSLTPTEFNQVHQCVTVVTSCQSNLMVGCIAASTIQYNTKITWTVQSYLGGGANVHSHLTRFLGPTQVHTLSSISICSVVLAQLTEVGPYTLQWAAGVPCSDAANIGEHKTWTQSEFCTWQNSASEWIWRWT